MRPRAAFLASYLLLASACLAQAQPVVERVEGTVTDPFGVPIAANATLMSLSGYLEATETDQDGRFVFESVVPGIYMLTVSITGFSTSTQEITARDASLDIPVTLVPDQPAVVVVTTTDPQGLALPGVVVSLEGPDGTYLEGITDSVGVYRTGSVRPGEWLVEAQLPGFGNGSTKVSAIYGPPAQAVLSLGLDYEVSEDLVVLGATRPVGRRTDVRAMDSPVTTAVVRGDSLAAQASPNVGDSLRGVPGLNIVQLSARDTQITSRQATGILANSQLVLLDGRSVYLDFFGMVLWDSLPIGTEDIEQIEVVRGPASVTWGPNAMTGAVHFITKAPRDTLGTTVTMGGGWMDRNAGSTAGSGPGTTMTSNVSVSRAPSDTVAYRISAGYFRSPALPRPVGQIPVAADPRAPETTVGGAYYPTDGAGPPGQAFVNHGTAQPKFDVRVDQDLANGGQLRYSGGVSATEGVTHTGLGPFNLHRGSYIGYGKVDYTRGELRLQAFTNIAHGVAPSLLLTDPATAEPVSFGFSNRTIDVDIGHSRLIGTRHVLGYGANIRHNTFGLNIAPGTPNRLELGAYLEDEVFLGPVQLTLGGRLDKFGNSGTPFFSPRVAAVWKPSDNQSIVVSYNRAFRSPSVIENFLQMGLIEPVNLSALAGFRPLLPGLLPPGLPPAAREAALADLEDRLDRTTSTPFPLPIRVIGSEIPVPGRTAESVGAESLTAYEVRYGASLGRATGLGAAMYLNQGQQSLIAVPVAPDYDPYTAAEPPPGWILPPETLTILGAAGLHLPRTTYRFGNRGGTRNIGLELWLDQGLWTASRIRLAYSWQARPRILDDERPYPIEQLSLPPAHRLSAIGTFDGSRFLGSASLTTATRAFWADVLTPDYHGFSDAYASVDAAFGVKWRAGAVTTSIKVTNLLNRTMQQHVFGDLLRRTVFAEVKLKL